MMTQMQSSQRRDFIFTAVVMLCGALVLWVAYQIGEIFWRTPFGLELIRLIQASVSAGLTMLQSFSQRQTAVMGLPLVRDTQAYWFMARAGGILLARRGLETTP